jgi:Ca-activated chloride channel family protein
MKMTLRAKYAKTVAASLLLLAALSGVTAHASAGSSQDQHKRGDEQDAVRLNATLVQVPAVVTDRGGRFVTDLSQNDFAIFEDGKRQELAVFTAVKQPFNAVLVLDTSNSAQDRLRAIQNTAVSFTRQLAPGDRMMVISFDNEVKQLTDFTSDAKELEAAIRATESGFGKLMYEAMTRALEQLKGVEGRRAVILFSDGIDMRSIDATAESTTRMAEEMNAVIYFVKFDTRWWMEAEARKHQAENKKSKLPFDVDGRIPLPPEYGGPDPTNPEIPKPDSPRIEISSGGIEVGGPRSRPTANRSPGSGPERPETMAGREPPDPIAQNLDKLYGEADAYLQTLTTRTGGRVFQAETFENTRSAFAMIADEMRNLYVLGYYPSSSRGDGKYHKIKLEVTRKAVQVRARPGYRSPKE